MTGTQDVPNIIAPPPLVYVGGLILGLILGALFSTPFLPGGLTWTVGLPLIALGVVLLATAFRAFRRAGTSPDPGEPTKRVVTDGPFRFTRNPIYLGFTLIYLGITVALSSLGALLLLLPALAIIDRGVIVREERYLARRFGDKYLRYKTRVRRWL